MNRPFSARDAIAGGHSYFVEKLDGRAVWFCAVRSEMAFGCGKDLVLLSREYYLFSSIDLGRKARALKGSPSGGG
jgi:hypothetical protein